MASTSLTRTPSSATNRKTFTISMWVKRAELSTQQCLFSVGNGSSNPLNFFGFYLDKFVYWEYSNSTTGLSDLQSNLVLRDPNAWYHLVASVDTTQATASDRIKLYVNGTQVTSFSSSSYPSQNQDLGFNNTQPHDIGRYLYSGTSYYGGEMAHFNFIDGTAYAPTDFGETDSTSGVWKPKTQPSVTYGTNGFFLKFANSASLGTDSSGNANDFTVNGSGTQTLDTPSNVYCTMNPLDNYFASGTFSQGNNTITTVNTGYPYNTATMGVNKGKWYWECKWSAQPTGSSNQVLVGIAKRVCPNTTTWLGSNPSTYAYQGTGGVHNNNGTIATYTTWSIGDVIGVALDMDNNRLYFSRNGTWQGSSDPANGTNPLSITAPDSTADDLGFYFPAFGDGNNSLQETGQFNFGNGTFGTTAISSPNNDGAGEGKFAYTVPTGYYALNTKNLKTYG